MAAFRTGFLLRSLIFILLSLSFSPFLFVDFSANRANAGVNLWVSNGLEGKVIAAIAIDPSRPTTLYAGTKEGVSKSIDGGLSWQAAGSGLPQATVWALAVDYSNPESLYAGTDEGVFKSTDGGSNWLEIGNGLTTMRVTALAMDPLTSRLLYAGTDGGVFKTIDGGLNWGPVNAGISALPTQALAIDPSNPRVLYVAVNGGIFKSVDSGEIWKSLNTTQNTDVWGLAIDPLNSNIVYAADSGRGVFKSQDGGLNWVPMNVGLTNTHAWALAIDSLHPNTLYAGTEGGVFKSADGGGKWVALKEGLPNTPVLVLTASPSDPAVLYAGTEGGGVFKIQQAGVVFAANCGGPQYVGKDGITYQADTNFSGGGTYATSAGIAGTEDGVLYQSERFGNFSYNIPVANGNYSVTLKFAEIYDNSPGTRVFNVNVEGKEVISKLDIFSKAAKNKAYDVTIPASVGDGVLNIEFKPVVGNAKVSAIVVSSSEVLPQVAIKATAGQGGNIAPSGDVRVNSGGSQVFTITPGAGYRILDVKVDGASQGAVNSYEFKNVTTGHTIEASFLREFVITATAGAGGKISPAGEVKVGYGSSQEFIITPDEGYHVGDVKVDGVSQGTPGSYTFNGVVANHTIEAAFLSDQPGKFSLAVNCGGAGYVGKDGTVYQVDGYFSGGGTYTTTAAIAGTEDGILYQNERYGAFAYNIPVANGNYFVIFKFAEIYNNSPGSRVFNVYMEGKEVISKLDIFAKVGKNKAYDVILPATVLDGVLNIEFKNVVGNAKVNGIAVSSSESPPQFVIQAQAGYGGKIEPSGEVPVALGSSQEFIITPNPGYRILDVKVDGVSQGTSDRYRFQNVTSNHRIEATFMPQFVITASGGPGGKIEPSGEVKVDYGGSQEFTITPDTGYRIADVRVNGVSQGVVNFFKLVNITANHRIEATFEQVQTESKVAFAVNCGGPQYIAKDGVTYQADRNFSGGSKYSTAAAIAGTEDDVLYQSERYGAFSYVISLPNREYRVTLKFAEIYSGIGQGTRVFDVRVEGATVISGLDLYDRVGKNRAYDVSIPIELVDGVLNIDLIRRKGDPKINAIMVAEYDTAPTVTIEADPKTIVTGGTSILTWASTRADSAFIEPGIGEVPVNGSMVVSPSGDTAYTITVFGPGGSKQGLAEVKVRNREEMTVITTAAGSDKRGFGGDEYPATEAKLNMPSGVAVDAAGNLFIADNFNYRIRMVDEDGIIWTVAGNGYRDCWSGGWATSTPLLDPMGVAVDFSGGLYIADTVCHRVRKLSPDAHLSIVAGSVPPCCYTNPWIGGYGGDDGYATDSQAALSMPYGVAADSQGNFYIADTKNHRVRKIDTDGIITTIAGDGGRQNVKEKVPATQSSLYEPMGVAVDDQGNLWIADTGHHLIRKVDREGIITTVAGYGGSCYKDGATTNFKGGIPAIQSCLGSPEGIAVDALGNLYVADPYLDMVLKVDGDGIIHLVAGTGEEDYGGDKGEAREAQLYNPTGVAVDALGNLYIADQGNHRIRKIEGVFQPPYGVIRGRVFEGEYDDWGLEEVAVTLIDSSQKTFTTQTDRRGRFGVSGVAPGDFFVSFGKEGYYKKTQAGTAIPGQATRLKVILEWIPPLDVKIESPSNGAVVTTTPTLVTGQVNKTAEVTVNGVKAEVSGNTFSAFVPLVEGSNNIVAKGVDETGDDDTDNIWITLVVRGTLAGKVTDAASGVRLSQVEVAVVDSLGFPRKEVTDGSGNYSIANVYAGPFSGEMKKEGYGPYLFIGNMVPAKTVPQDGALSRILPKIRSIEVKDITSSSARVTWETDQVSDRLVEYGLTETYVERASDPTMTMVHSVPLSNLSSNTTYHFRVTSTNQYGFSSSSEDGTFKTRRLPIEVNIFYPAEGDTINGKEVTVLGSYFNPLGKETAVRVNGVMAMVGDVGLAGMNYFVVNHLPLQEGENIIEAVAVDGDGESLPFSVQVNSVPRAGYLRLVANVELGMAPLEARLRIDSSINYSYAELACECPAWIGYTEISPTEVEVRMFKEDLYVFRVRAADGEGVRYEDKIGILVVSKNRLESLLKAKWEEMRLALLQGNVERALNHFVSYSQERYRSIFLSFSSEKMQAVFGDIIDLRVGSISDYVAYCGAIRREDEELYSYPVTFILDRDGVWKIKSF